MTWYPPATDLDFAVGEIPTAAKLDKIGANLNAINSTPAARLASTINQGVSPGIYTDINFDAEVWDTDGCHDNSTNPHRLTCKIAGHYLLYGHFFFESNSTGTFRQAIWKPVNSGTPGEIGIGGGFPPAVGAPSIVVLPTTEWYFAVNDYVSIQVLHDASSAIQIVRDDFRSPVMGWRRQAE